MTSKTVGRSGSAAEILSDQRSNKVWDNSAPQVIAGRPDRPAPPFQHNRLNEPTCIRNPEVQSAPCQESAGTGYAMGGAA